MPEYEGKSIAVIGMARTGMAVAEVMTRLGARVVLFDRKSPSDLTDALEAAADLGVEARAGAETVDLTGIDMVVPSPGVPRSMGVFAEAEARGVEVISEIELAYRLAKAPIIAITGTNGKTTTTVLTGRIMIRDGRETYIAGNVAAGDIKLPLVSAAYQAPADGVIVAEISTFQLEWIQSFRPHIAMLLNVTSDHLDRHANIEEYREMKARIFENQTASDFAVINAENAFTASLADGLSARVLRFSGRREVSEGAWVRGDHLIVRFGGMERPVCLWSDIRLRGEHNVENVLAAACAAVAFGARPESIAEAVRGFGGVEHRLETVATIDGVEYINNSMCTNVDAGVRSVEAIDGPQIVIAGGKDKEGDYRPLGEAFRRKAKHVVLIGADADIIQAAAENAGFHEISRASSMREALTIARGLATAGDTVVLSPACASFDMFSGFEERGQVFRDIVSEFEGEPRRI